VQEARTLVQERYLDGHDAMFPDLASAWDERVHCTQEIAAMAVRLAEIDGVAPAAEPGPEAISRRTAELVRRPGRASKAEALEKLGEGRQSLEIAAGWVGAKLAPAAVAAAEARSGKSLTDLPTSKWPA